jgi:hypothetical protein
MNRQSESFPEFFRDRNLQGRTSGNAKPKLWQHRNIFHFTKRLIKDRHAGKDGRIRLCEIVKNSARGSVLAQNHCHAARD